MRHGTQGHVAEPSSPPRAWGRESGADASQGHASPCGRPGGATWQCEVVTKRFRAVVKHTKRKSNKIYKTELTKIRYKIN